jgi:triosephosphate isomerase
MTRKPFALANWKMEMTVAQSLAFLRDFGGSIGRLADAVEIVLCPPCTALYAMSEALGEDSRIALGGQNVSAAAGGAYTSEISAGLLRDAGCRWVMLGHWEVRRHLGDTDATVNRRLYRALEAGLRAVPLVGPGHGEEKQVRRAVERQLAAVLKGCTAEQVRQMAFIYEPEWAIGAATPAPPEEVAAGCGQVRAWLGERFGREVAEAVRVIYGGSVTPRHARALLASADVDGLGAGRKGRDPFAFAQIVRTIATAKAAQ